MFRFIVLYWTMIRLQRFNTTEIGNLENVKENKVKLWWYWKWQGIKSNKIYKKQVKNEVSLWIKSVFECSELKIIQNFQKRTLNTLNCNFTCTILSLKINQLEFLCHLQGSIILCNQTIHPIVSSVHETFITWNNWLQSLNLLSAFNL